MISFPNCKINIGLRILRKRNDGYHDVESVMLPLPIQDVLEIIPLQEEVNHKFTFSGKIIPGKLEDNLIFKAVQLLEEITQIPPLHIHLHKRIPMGGGLGGGSSNGTYTLKLINGLLSLNLSERVLHELSAKLGSDCAFFINSTPQFATGRGEVLSSFELNSKGYYLLLVNDGTHISTKTAYGAIQPKEVQFDWDTLKGSTPDQWKDLLVINDFEQGIFKLHPHLKELKQKLYEMGAVYASMTGSGSTMYGFFKDKPAHDLLNADGFVEVVSL